MMQLSRDDIKSMTPEQVDEAEQNGQLDALLGRGTPELIALKEKARSDHLTIADVKALHDAGAYELIERARTEGRIQMGNNL